MAGEKLVHQEIVPRRQITQVSCVPSSISMLFSGFGVDFPEETLIEEHFVTTKLPVGNIEAGVKDTSSLAFIVETAVRLGLAVDIFDPELWQDASSAENSCIVRASSRAIRSQKGRISDNTAASNSWWHEFYHLQDRFAHQDKLGVYTANGRLVTAGMAELTHTLVSGIREGFYQELAAFIREGHVFGSHGGMSAHARVIDGKRSTMTDAWIVDPRGSSYPIAHQDLMCFDDLGIRGDALDYLLRLSIQDRREPAPRLIDRLRGRR